ncbi:hypothetical protein ACFL67_02385 [candidate division KSB1 bacterium]
MATALQSSYYCEQIIAISTYRETLQKELKRTISQSEAILYWIISGCAETYRKEFFLNTIG